MGKWRQLTLASILMFWYFYFVCPRNYVHNKITYWVGPPARPPWEAGGQPSTGICRGRRTPWTPAWQRRCLQLHKALRMTNLLTRMKMQRIWPTPSSTPSIRNRTPEIQKYTPLLTVKSPDWRQRNLDIMTFYIFWFRKLPFPTRSGKMQNKITLIILVKHVKPD